MKLREPSERDVPALVVLIERYFHHDEIPFDASSVSRALATLLADPRLGRAYLVEVGEMTVGYAILTIGFDLEMGGAFALLTDLYLEPAHRGRGLGARVVRELEERATTLGLRTFELTVERDNVEAQALYRKAGFIERDRLPMTKRLV